MLTSKERNRMACLKAISELTEASPKGKDYERDIRRYIDLLELEIMQFIREDNLRRQKEVEHVSEDSI